MARWQRALITGASAGIGAEIARQLAAEGVDLILVARRMDRLEALRDECSSVSVEVLGADLARSADIARVGARLESDIAPVDLLVNNAGFGSYGRFWEQPIDDALGQVDVNVRALVQLSHAAATQMVRNGRGAILQVSSIAGNQPSANNAVYGATKAFVTNFSEALAIELRGTGVTVTASCPGLTHTEFHDVAGLGTRPSGPEFLWMDADAVARDALRATAQKKVVRVNGLGNRVLAIASQLAPRSVRRAAATRVVASLRR